MPAGGLQHIRIEERVALHRDARQGGVIERPLQDVDVLGVAPHQEHAMIPEDVGERSAGLAIRGLVGQLVLAAEAFGPAGGADAAGDVELRRHDVAPDPVDGVDVLHIARQGRDVGHAGVHVGGADRVADRFILIDHRDVILGVEAVEAGLAVGPAIAEPATLIQEELGGVEILGVAGDAVEPAQADFNFLVSRRIGPFVRAEEVADVVGAFRGDVQEGLVAGHLVVGHGGFEHVPDAVLLMHVLLIDPAILRLPLGQRIERIQIAVGPLGGGHDGDELVEVQSEHGIGVDLKRIRGRSSMIL